MALATETTSPAVSREPAPVPGGDLVVQRRSLAECIADPGLQRELTAIVAAGDIPVFKGVGDPDTIAGVKRHLHSVMLGTLESFTPIAQGAPNNMRLSLGDPRASVPLWCISWSFFSWNRDLFKLYETYGDIYRVRNLMSGFAPETFISKVVELGCAARLCVHLYPRSKGVLGAHTDPLGNHQIATATMVMSTYGQEFNSGGYYVRRADGTHFYVENELAPGDVYFCNPACIHGVDTIDPEAPHDPLGAVGRWAMLFPVNKIAGNTAIGDSVGYDA